MPNHLSNSKPARDYSLDIIRGIVVLIMIIAHAIDFYHDGSSTFLHYLVISINTITFTIFLFLSGAIAYLVYLKNHYSEKTLFHHIGRRLGLLLGSYYVLVCISLFDKIISASLYDQLRLILDVLLFRNVPSYTEFLIPFLLFSLLIIPLRKTMTKLAENIPLAITVSLGIYALGMLLYHISLPSYLIPWKALLVGHDSIYRFPIFQYFPIYIFGLQWGRYLVNTSNVKEKGITSQILLWLTAGILIISVAVYLLMNTPISHIFLRWPPSVPFLLTGLLAIFILFRNVYSSKEYRHHPFIRDTLLLLGQNALALYWAHIFLLKLYKMAGGITVSSPILVAVMLIVLILTSLALATFVPFNFGFHLTFVRESSGRPFFSYNQSYLPPIYQIAEDISHKPKFHFRFAYVAVGIALFFAMISFFTATQNKIFAEPKRSTRWWNMEYSYKQPITIKNNQSVTMIKSGTPVLLSINHRQLVQDQKSLISGNDIRILFFDGHSFHDIPRQIVNNWNSDNSLVSFQLSNNIGANKTSLQYFLYYGNLLADSPLTNTIVSSTNSLAELILSGEETRPYFAKSNRQWFLKSDYIAKTEPLILTLESKQSSRNTSLLVKYEVVGTGLNGTLSPSQTEENIWEAQIDVSSLSPGSYRARCIIEDARGETELSQSIGFNVSYPLYVTWSWDWEGYDVSQSYLNDMEQLSLKHHSIKMTHFFSPRIYTAPNISPERRQYLTDWVKNRRDNFGEQIALHLHMFPDFVSDSGVIVKDSPRWGFYQDGYDILTTAYSYDEILKMINRAKQYFELNGLGVPTAYRTGGWYANEETLRAIQDAGIKVDSSGRTTYAFGARKQPGFWDLKPTDRPYYPSVSNQNSSYPSPNLSLLEIPNNGADSYSFSAQDMIQRFKMNYNGSPLSQKQQITYLTHPHWFNSAEQKRVDELFTYVDQFYYDLDNGPVIYATTEQVYQAFTLPESAQ
ncbi:MAG: acyltransferase family protein [bacterium]|nr:acyltransferase family protein [bacterium]